MIINGSKRVDAQRDRLWSALSEPDLLAQALPAVDDVTVTDRRQFSATAHPTTGLGSTPVSLSFEIVEERPEEFVRIDASGTAGENAINVSLRLTLDDDKDCTTATWVADVHILGVLGSLLQRGLSPLFNEQLSAILDAAAGPASRHDVAA